MSNPRQPKILSFIRTAVVTMPRLSEASFAKEAKFHKALSPKEAREVFDYLTSGTPCRLVPDSKGGRMFRWNCHQDAISWNYVNEMLEFIELSDKLDVRTKCTSKQKVDENEIRPIPAKKEYEAPTSEEGLDLSKLPTEVLAAELLLRGWEIKFVGGII